MTEQTLSPDNHIVVDRLKQTDIPRGTIKPRHLENGLAAVKFGQSTERPNEGGLYPVYFSLDTGILSIWDNTSWVDIN